MLSSICYLRIFESIFHLKRFCKSTAEPIILVTQAHISWEKEGIMLRINELRENRAKAWEAAKNFLDTHQTENGTLSAEDAATYDRMEADVVNLGAEIARLERREALDAEMAKPDRKSVV